MYGRHIPIAPPETHRETWWTRTRRTLSPFTTADTLATSDGEMLQLPASVDASSGDAAALARYRLLAIEQGERVMRGTALVAAQTTDRLERDLFLLRESAAIDAAIARSVRNVGPTLTAARAHALERRPLMESLTGAEREVENLVRQLLAADPATPPSALAGHATAEESLAWARETAARLRRPAERYRGITPIDVWGNVLAPSPNILVEGKESLDTKLTQARIFNLVELPGVEAGGKRRAVPSDRGAEPEQPVAL